MKDYNDPANVQIHHHKLVRAGDKSCGACGSIAYSEGRAYSVNVYRSPPHVEYRYRLDQNYLPTCVECLAHVEAAKESK